MRTQRSDFDPSSPQRPDTPVHRHRSSWSAGRVRELPGLLGLVLLLAVAQGGGSTIAGECPDFPLEGCLLDPAIFHWTEVQDCAIVVPPNYPIMFDARHMGYCEYCWTVSGCDGEGDSCCEGASECCDESVSWSYNCEDAFEEGVLRWAFCEEGEFEVRVAASCFDGITANVWVTVDANAWSPPIWDYGTVGFSAASFLRKPAYLNQFGDTFLPHDAQERHMPLGPEGSWPSGGVRNGTFAGSAYAWVENTPVGGDFYYLGELTVEGPSEGQPGFTWASQDLVDLRGGILAFDLLRYLSAYPGDFGQWDRPVFFLDNVFYGLNHDGTLGTEASVALGDFGDIDNSNPVSSPIHFSVDVESLVGPGPHVIGFGVLSVDADDTFGIAEFDNVLPPATWASYGDGLELQLLSQTAPFGEDDASGSSFPFLWPNDDVLTQVQFSQSGTVNLNVELGPVCGDPDITWWELFGTYAYPYTSFFLYIVDTTEWSTHWWWSSLDNNCSSHYPGIEFYFDVLAGHNYEVFVGLDRTEPDLDLALWNEDPPFACFEDYRIPFDISIDGPSMITESDILLLNPFDGGLVQDFDQTRGEITYYEFEVPATAVGPLRIQAKLIHGGLEGVEVECDYYDVCPDCRYAELVLLDMAGNPVAWSIGGFDDEGNWHAHLEPYTTAAQPEAFDEGDWPGWADFFGEEDPQWPAFTATVPEPLPQGRYVLRVGPEWAVYCDDLQRDEAPGRPFTCVGCGNGVDGATHSLVGARVEVDPVAFDLEMIDAPAPAFTAQQGQISVHFGIQNHSISNVHNPTIHILEIDEETGQTYDLISTTMTVVPRADLNQDGTLDEVELSDGGIVWFGECGDFCDGKPVHHLDPLLISPHEPDSTILVYIDANDPSELDQTNNSAQSQLPFAHPRIETISFGHDDPLNGPLVVGRFIAYGEAIPNPTTIWLSDPDEDDPEGGGIWRYRIDPLGVGAFASAGAQFVDVPMGGANPIEQLEFVVIDHAGFEDRRLIDVHTVDLPDWFRAQLDCGAPRERGYAFDVDFSFDPLRDVFTLRAFAEIAPIDTTLRELTGWTLPFGSRPIRRGVTLDFSTELPIYQVDDMTCRLELCSFRNLFGWETSDCRDILNDPDWQYWELGRFRVDMANFCLDWDNLDGQYDVVIQVEITEPIQSPLQYTIPLWGWSIGIVSARIELYITPSLHAASGTIDMRLRPVLDEQIACIVPPSHVYLEPAIEAGVRGAGSILWFDIVRIEGYFVLGLGLDYLLWQEQMPLVCLLVQDYEDYFRWDITGSASLGVCGRIRWIFGWWTVFRFEQTWQLFRATGDPTPEFVGEIVPHVDPQPAAAAAENGEAVILYARDGDERGDSAWREMCARRRPEGSDIFDPPTPLLGWNRGLTNPVVAYDGIGGAVAFFIGNAFDIKLEPTSAGIMNAMEIAYAHCDGGEWEPVERITFDSYPDGAPTLGCSGTGWCVGAWSKNMQELDHEDFSPNATGQAADHSEIYYAVYEAPGAWVRAPTNALDPSFDGSFHDVWAAATDDVYAVGEAGMILHYTGSSFDVVEPDIAEATGDTFTAVWGDDADALFVASQQGHILHWTGCSWSLGPVTGHPQPEGQVLYVNAGAPPDGDGTSWETAYDELQDALLVAAQPAHEVSEIWVAAGTYTPDYDTNTGAHTMDPAASFHLLEGVSLYGGFAGTEVILEQRDPIANATILSGNLGDSGDPFIPDHSFHIVTANAVDGTTTVDRFTIAYGGNPNDIGHGDVGAGMYLIGSNPVVANCTFLENLSTRGGAVFNQSSSPTVVNCSFVDNNAEDFDGAAGGAMCNTAGSNPLLVNCVFLDNQASSWTQYAIGGGIHSEGSAPTLVNCTLTGNTADLDGGAVSSLESAATIINCILWDNDAFFDSQISGDTANVSYSCVEGGWFGTGIISGDPLFSDAANGDLHLASGSPCIDAGRSDALPADLADLDTDADKSEAAPVDIEGNMRRVDDPLTTDCPHPEGGCGEPPVVDIGALEYGGAAPARPAINDIHGTGPNSIVAVGDTGHVVRFDGTRWRLTETGVSEDLHAAWQTASGQVFAVGDNGTILHYDGVAWSAMSSGTGESLRGIWGSSDDSLFTVGTTGTVLHYDGDEWSSIASGTSEDLYSLCGSRPDRLFASGSHGTILRSDGDEWTHLESGSKHDLYAVSGAPSSDAIVAVGGEGTILRHSAETMRVERLTDNAWSDVRPFVAFDDLGEFAVLAWLSNEELDGDPDTTDWHVRLAQFAPWGEVLEYAEPVYTLPPGDLPEGLALGAAEPNVYVLALASQHEAGQGITGRLEVLTWNAVEGATTSGPLSINDGGSHNDLQIVRTPEGRTRTCMGRNQFDYGHLRRLLGSFITGQGGHLVGRGAHVPR